VSIPKVSVIIPTYNRADLVSQAIDSVLQQTFTDFEVIVVDDGSTDDTARVVKAYGDRVQYVWTTNGGTGHARNVGMLHARGMYFTFLDSDDVLYPYALDLETRLLDKYPSVSMVCAEVTGFNDRGWAERYHMKAYHASSFRDPSVTYDAIFQSSMPLLETGAIPGDVIHADPSVAGRRAYFGNVFESYLTGIILFQNSSMLRREVVAEIGPRNEFVYCFEELDYLMRLSRHHDVLFADVPTYKLRYHGGQLSNTSQRDGKARWVRTQRHLLRVVKRHILADQSHYERNRTRLDRRLSDLHRSVAIPMLLMPDGGARGERYARHARLYLARCSRYGHPQRALYAASMAPGPIRRAIVSVIETVRKEGIAAVARRALKTLTRTRLITSAATLVGSWTCLGGCSS
jgi:glycosyltransferase involved in cell wall biosynthesis